MAYLIIMPLKFDVEKQALIEIFKYLFTKYAHSRICNAFQPPLRREAIVLYKNRTEKEKT